MTYVVLDHIGRGETGRAKHEENVVKRLMERVCRKAGLPESGWHHVAPTNEKPPRFK